MSPPLASRVLTKVGRVVAELAALGKKYAIYGAEHPRTQTYLEKYMNLCAEVRQYSCVQSGELTIACRGNRLYYESSALPDSAQEHAVFIEHIQKNRWAGFSLSLELSEPELCRILRNLGFGQGVSDEEVDDSQGFRWLGAGELDRRESSATQRSVRQHLLLQIPELGVSAEEYYGLFHELAIFMGQCSTPKDLDLEPLRQATNALVDQVMAAPEKVLPLLTVPYYDEFNYYHCVNVTLLAIAAAQRIVESREQLLRVGLAAILHDVGKAQVPLDIMYKTGRLTEEETRVMMEHPVEGARLLQQLPGMDPLAVAAAFGHHIKDGGTGYPQVPPHFRIGPVTALIEVCDIFEALTALRPYKRPLSAAQAFELLASMPNLASQRHWIELLFHTLGQHPVGSRVRTTDGALGLVCGHDESAPLHPMIRLVMKGPMGLPMAGEIVPGYRVGDEGGNAPESAIVALDPEEELELTSAL